MSLGLVVVGEGHAAVIERGGQFHTVLGPGRHFVRPFADRVRARFDLGEQILTAPPRPVEAGDRQEVLIGFEVVFAVTDPRLATYEISNPAFAIEQLARTALRQEAGLTTAERAITAPGDLHRTVWTVLHDTTGRWGITTKELQLEVSPPAAPGTPSTAQEWY
ncbi:band 7 domain-containing protein [Amycolatopsis balhimycina DSM 5908]|uniref:Band 7 domain-containing protein n=1 Tax=Amycolatopsis balhimycina DSM 5908 TaxID=1081091 RepID=A0A428WTH5_AMYBA|nr:SPFH domain-containing protein [Amycolatopsis balhimycina]RSM46366.1 band 7 domain-containing protein [Amycolatopsis balhimycina DSM 5908]